MTRSHHHLLSQPRPQPSPAFHKDDLQTPLPKPLFSGLAIEPKYQKGFSDDTFHHYHLFKLLNDPVPCEQCRRQIQQSLGAKVDLICFDQKGQPS